MAKPLTPAQALQNRAFLRMLRRTGNVRLACREVGLKYGTMQHRRRVHAGFAAKWDAELVVAQAALAKRLKKGPSTASGPPPLQKQGRMGAGDGPCARGDDVLGKQALTLPRAHPSPGASSAAHRQSGGLPRTALPLPARGEGLFRTAGGETVVVRLKSGKLQVRRAQAGKLTREAEQAFLSALSVTCNISLAAAAVGSCFRAFDRRRKTDPAFAREMRMALAQGYETLEAELLSSTLAQSHEHDEWRSNDPPAIPPMTANQALQLMYLHQKAVLQLDEPDYLKKRRGESWAMHCERLARMAEERARRSREEFEVAEVERWERGEPAWGPAGEDVRAKLALRQAQDERSSPLGLPDLAQVAGWSRADASKVPHHEGVALFGGWRLEDMKEALDEW